MAGRAQARGRTVTIGCALVFLGLGAPRLASAGNDDEVFLGNQATLAGGAVTATVHDGASLVYEPSGLAEGEDQAVDVSVTAISVRVHSAQDLVAVRGGPRPDARYIEFVSIPSTLAYTRSLSSRTRIGFGAFATRGAALRMRESSEVPGDGEQTRYQLAQQQRGSAIVLSLGVGHRVNDVLRLGVSLGVVYDNDETNFTFSAARSLDEPLMERTTDSLTINSVANYSRFGVRATFGMRYVPNERFRVALSVTTPGLAFAGVVSESESTAFFTSRPAVPTGDHQLTVTDELAFRAGTFSPLRVRLGLAARVQSAVITLDGDLQAPVRDDSYGVRRDLVLNARAGVRVSTSPTLSFGGGLFTDRSGVAATSSATNGSTENRDFYGATFGIEHVKVRRLAEGEDAAALRFVSTYALRYAFAVGNVGGVLVDPSFDARTLGAIEANRVRAVTHDLGLYIGSSLRF